MNKLSPRQKAASKTAAAQRKLCLDWLLFIMSKSSVKMRTKEDLRAEAIVLGPGRSSKVATGTGTILYQSQESELVKLCCLNLPIATKHYA